MKSHRELNGNIAEIRNAIMAINTLNAQNAQNLIIGENAIKMMKQLERISENLKGLEGGLENDDMPWEARHPTAQELDAKKRGG